MLVGLALLLQPFQADEWYRFLPSTGRNADPVGVFKLVNGQLHVLDIPVTNDFQEFGYVATTRDYSNYHLRLRYRWGDKRFVPRASEKRDSGVLYHVVGPDLIWPRSVECQIQEGDTGDIFLVDGTGATTTVSPVPTSGRTTVRRRRRRLHPGRWPHRQRLDGRFPDRLEQRRGHRDGLRIGPHRQRHTGRAHERHDPTRPR